MKFRRYPRRFYFRKRFKRYRPLSAKKFYQRKPLPFRYVVLLSFVFFLLSTSFGLWIVNKGIKPTLTKYARSQSVNLATYVINKAIEEEIGTGLNLDEIIKVVPYGNRSLTTFDNEKIIEVSNNITKNILKNINGVEQGDVYSVITPSDGEIGEIKTIPGEGLRFTVPFGRITNNVLLAHIGPDIPVQFRAIGEIESNIEYFTKEHQINSTWYEVKLHLKVGIQMLIPFDSEIKIIPHNVTLASGEIKGEVQYFYCSGGHAAPSIIMPEKKEWLE